MAFSYRDSKGTISSLHGRVTRLRNDPEQQISLFSETSEDGLERLPAGFEVSEVRTSGLPVLEKNATG